MTTIMNEVMNGFPELTEDNLQSIFDLDSEQFSLQDAPTYKPLMVTSKNLRIDTDNHGSQEVLSVGDILIKVPLEKAASLSRWYYSRLRDSDVHEGEGLFIVLNSSNVGLDYRIHTSIIGKSEGLVIALEDVYYMEDSMLNSSIDLDEFLLNSTRQARYDKTVEEASPDTLTVLVLGERDSWFSRSWKSTVNPFDAVRWTNESADIHYAMSRPEVYHIIVKD